MCYYKFHTCKYCGNQYECNIKNWICPTNNDDEDRNMCDICREKLEDKLMFDEDFNLEDLMK